MREAKQGWGQTTELAASQIQQGKTLVRELGCVACHEIKGLDTTVRAEAPNLTYEGEIVRRDWLFDFIKKPHGIRPAIKARMPNLRLTDREAIAITEFLAGLVDGETVPQEFRYSRKTSAAEIEAAKKLMSPDYFNCFSCHILGDKKPSGDPKDWAPDLTRIKGRINPDFLLKWLRDPSKYRPGTKMPGFFPDKDSGPDDILGGDEMRQMAAIRDYLFSLGKTERFPEYAKVKAKIADVSPTEGRTLMVKLNCVGCHEVAVLPVGKKVAPKLTYEGSRVQKKWLIAFLRAPHSIKPEYALMGLPTRMPTFQLTEAESLDVAEFISQVLVDQQAEKETTVDFTLATRGKKLFTEKTCNSCHRIGSSPSGIGPELTEAGERLRPGWVINFIQNPEHFLDTRMPNLKVSPDQARALAAYVLGPKN
jgi:mono/diheme cytochrome c family protein